LPLIRSFRLPALFCALSVLLCELITRPYASMSVCDDGPYILMARTLATTGHVVYNGWAAPMLGWQLYLGAAFIKIFGFSFTAVRGSTVLVAMALAFLLQRTLVLAGITERNATLGTLAFVLSPLYLMLSVTYMTDIFGLFAILLCLYGCLRALQATTSNSPPSTTIAWLCFAVITNALCGTSRQIAWLGILILLPSTLWLLRAQRRVIIAGTALTLAGVLFILACMHWLKHQPYVIPEHVLPTTFPLGHTLAQLLYLFLDAPFLLLPLFAVFLPTLRKSPPRRLAALCATFLGYLFLALYPSHLRGNIPLEPTLFNGNWVSVHGIYEGVVSLSDWHSTPPLFLHTGVRILLTIASLGGLLGLLVSVTQPRNAPHRNAPHRNAQPPSRTPSWKQLATLLLPITLVYILLLLPRATGLLFDRYLLPLLVFAVLCLVRFYQERVQPQLPLASVFLVAIMAIYGIAVTHNMFSLDRARIALAAELRSNGVPDTSVDYGWEYNLLTELQLSSHINEKEIALPSNAYVPVPPPPPGICHMLWYDDTPHIHPLYGISFQPNVCAGPAPFAPVHYSRWLASSPCTLYVVRYLPPVQP
jgi:hypothetical protein